MPSPSLHALAQDQQDQLLDIEERLQSELRESYQFALKRLDKDIQRLTDKIAQARANGEAVSESWLFQASRLQSLEAQIVGELEQFGEYVEERVTAMQHTAVKLGEEYAHELIEAGMPNLRHNLQGLPVRAVEALVGRSTHDGSLLSVALSKYPEAARAAIRKQLVGGVALGYSPKKIAGKLSEQLGGARSDYMTLATTETLNAHRMAALSTYAQNSNVVSEWEWMLGKSDACSFCQGKSKKRFSLSTPFDTHPRCKCACVPILREAA
jgi:hypothetical protein